MLRSNAKDGEFDILASGLPLSEGESVEVTWGLAAWMLRRARLKAGAAHGWAVPAFFIFTNNSLDGNAYHFYGTIIARGMALHSPHADLGLSPLAQGERIVKTKARKPLFERLKKGLEEGIAHAKSKLTLKTVEMPVAPPEIEGSKLKIKSNGKRWIVKDRT